LHAETHQNREYGKRPLPISPAALQVAEFRQLGVANIRHLPRLTLDHPALTIRAARKIFWVFWKSSG